jgi:hypothetical protein
MTITLFDPRTGKPVTITVPDKPSSTDRREKVGGGGGVVRESRLSAAEAP